MKKVFIIEENELQQLKGYLGEINHALYVMDQNKDHLECMKNNRAVIDENLKKAMDLVSLK